MQNNILFKTVLLKGESGNNIVKVEKTSTSGLVDTYTITLTDGTTNTFEVSNGSNIKSIVKTSTSGLVDTYTITLTDGTTSTFEVTNAVSITGVEKTATSGIVDTYTITYNNGTTSTFEVKNGQDYTVPTGGVIYYNGDTAPEGYEETDAPITNEQKNALNSGITTDKVTQIAQNTTDIANLTANINNVKVTILPTNWGYIMKSGRVCTLTIANANYNSKNQLEYGDTHTICAVPTDYLPQHDVDFLDTYSNGRIKIDKNTGVLTPTVSPTHPIPSNESWARGTITYITKS